MEISSQNPEVDAKITSDCSKITIPVLPDEIVTDIISRLPVKPVFQLQCLSKNFSSITNNLSFVKAHLRQSASLRPSIMVNKGHDIYLIRSNALDSEITVDKVPFNLNIKLTNNSNQKLRIVGSCNGLVVIYAHVASIVHFNDACLLWNPITNKCDYLPSPGRIVGCYSESAAWAFGYCTESNVYKIVRIASFPTELSIPTGFDCFSGTKSLVEILTYGTDRAWRKLDFRKFDEMCNVHSLSIFHGITVKGVVYWKPAYDKQNGNKILTFDLEKENFAWISCPASVGAQIMEIKGSLALCIKSEVGEGNYDLLVLKNVIYQAGDHFDYGCHTVYESFWEKLYTTDFLSSMPLSGRSFLEKLFSSEFTPYNYMPIRCLNDHQLLLLKDVTCYGTYSFSLYDLECKTIKEIPQVESGSKSDVFNFVESMVPLSAMGFDSEYKSRIYPYSEENPYFWLNGTQEKMIRDEDDQE